MFNSVTSEAIEIEIINPCLTSVVNGDQDIVIEDMTVAPGQTLLELLSDGPTDSASVTYGNGYDKCGNLTYIWLDRSSNNFETKWFSYNSTVEIDSVDQISMVLSSESSGTVIKDYVTLITKLEEYPSATPAIFDLVLSYRECYPHDFSGPEIGDIELIVGEEGPEIDYFFDQFPCNWNQTYDITITGKDGETKELPVFIGTDGTLMILDGPSVQDIGKYNVKICSTIKNSLLTTSCTDFDLEVKPQGGANITVTIKPEWMIELKD